MQQEATDKSLQAWCYDGMAACCERVQGRPIMSPLSDEDRSGYKHSMADTCCSDLCMVNTPAEAVSASYTHQPAPRDCVQQQQLSWLS